MLRRLTCGSSSLNATTAGILTDVVAAFFADSLLRGRVYSRPVNARIDHLVIAADSLEQGTAWCEALFGVQPSGGWQTRLDGHT